MMKLNIELSEKVKRLPTRSGVYIMKSKDNKILYIGKAKNLKNRVLSYFHFSNQNNDKIKSLVSKIADIDIILTDNEIEALILENNLIKKHRPYYNIELKYNERYPYIKITKEPFPRLLKTRIKKDDDSYYFGPFPSVKSINSTIKTITDIFPLRRCNRKIDNNNYSPCLNYYLGKCKSPCSGKINEKEYNKMVEQVILFLKGKNKRLIEMLKKEMENASKNRNFELAIEIRDRLKAINTIMQEQKITSSNNENEDIIALFDDGNLTHVSILIKRNGKIIGLKDFDYETKLNQQESFEQFLQLYYDESFNIPERIIIPIQIENAVTLSNYLSAKAGKNIKIENSYNSNERKLIRMAEKNALYKIKERSFNYKPENALTALKDILHLFKVPSIIEGFDVATLLGDFSVASMVKFVNGLPSKKEYRRYRIRYSGGQNDVEMMKEAVARRYQRLINENKALPDIILIDGGLPQINGVDKIIKQLGLKNITILGLAKKEELIYLPHNNKPISLLKTDDSLKLLMAIRNEAHRFANSYHFKLRDKEKLKSKLMKIKGVGEKRALNILRNLESLKSVNIDDIASIPGIGNKYASKIQELLKQQLK